MHGQQNSRTKASATQRTRALKQLESSKQGNLYENPSKITLKPVAMATSAL